MNAKQRKQAQAIFTAAMSVAGFVGLANAADITFSWVGPPAAGGNVSWGLASNWAGGVAPPQTPAAGDNTIFAYGGSYSVGTSTQNATGAAANVADYTINKFIFNDYTNASGTSTTGSLLLNTTGTGSRAIYLGSGGIFMNTTPASTSGGSVSLQTGGTPTESRLFLTADQTWTVNNLTANLVIKRPIEGAFTIIKDGVGSLQLSAPAAATVTLGGVTQTITANATFNGTLDLRQGGVRLDTTGLQFASSAAHLVVNTNNDVSISATNTGLDQTINGVVFLGGTGTLSLAGSSSFLFTNTVTLLSDKTVTQGGAATSSFRGGLFVGAIVGPGGITKGGAGSFGFSGTNTYAGNTTVTNGWLAIDNPNLNLGSATTPIALGNGGGSAGTVGALVVRGADQATNRGLTINSGGGSIDFAGGLTIGAVAGSSGSTGSLFKAGAGTLTVSSIDIGGTLVATTGSVVTKPNGTSNRVAGLTLGGASGAWSSQLDLNNNSLVIDYTGAANSPLATVVDQIKSGYASGSWTGQGIASGSAAAVAIDPTIHKTELGYAEASALGISTFNGLPVDSDAIVIRYTLQGDANLDGKVNALDFNALASHFGQAAPWSGGDFNYDGSVSTGDFTAMGQNFGLAVSPAPTLGSLVPEPMTVGIVGSLCLILRRRRRVASHESEA